MTLLAIALTALAIATMLAAMAGYTLGQQAAGHARSFTGKLAAKYRKRAAAEFTSARKYALTCSFVTVSAVIAWLVATLS